MLRFLFNFVAFGVLFYAISLLFPDAFKTLVSWADTIYGFLRDFVLWAFARINEFRQTHTTPPPETPKAWLPYLNAFLNK